MSDSDALIRFTLQLRPLMVNALQVFLDFEKAMHEIQTSPGTSQESLSEVSNALLEMGECNDEVGL